MGDDDESSSHGTFVMELPRHGSGEKDADGLELIIGCSSGEGKKGKGRRSKEHATSKEKETMFIAPSPALTLLWSNFKDKCF